MPEVPTAREKVIIITGSASGIGLATAKLFAAQESKIVLVDVDEIKLNEIKQHVLDSGASQVLTFKCDVSREEEVVQTVKGTLEKLGRIDVIVNNAGLMIFKSLVEHTTDDWMRVLNVDLMGAFYFIREALLHMVPGGVIINVSSIHAVETTPSVSSYAAAKAALLSLTRSAAIEGKNKNIRVNAVLPGAIDTPMLWKNPNIKAGLEVIHQSDVGKSEDIAAAIVFLASDGAKFIQGTSLRVDGGRLGQICGLQWSNIDLKNRRMLVKHTSVFHPINKTFLELKPFPKNKEARPVFITDEILELLKRREAFRVLGNDFVFHVEGKPINYCTVQLNYREAQRKSGVPYSGTHILRHGMAKLARQVGGGLDAVLAMTGHKDLKLADHYSKCDEDDQKTYSEKIMDHIRNTVKKGETHASFENVVALKSFKKAVNT